MAAGKYPTRFEWRRKTAGTPDTFGQKPKEHENLGSLWGAVEDLAANRTTEKESERQLTSATIRLRNYPEVAPGDLLREAGSGVEWSVRTAIEGDNEIECEAEHR